MKTLSTKTINPVTGFVKVKPTMQIADDSHPNIFAAGDIVDTDHIKTAYFAWEQMRVVMSNISKLVRIQQQQQQQQQHKNATSSNSITASQQHDSQLTVYKAGPPMIIVYLGQKQGAAQYNFFGFPILMPNWFVKRFFTYNVGADRAWIWMNQDKSKVLN
jgi:NADH dehydrogenase FAD-containing subunit